MATDAPIFRERQRVGMLWVWLLMAALTVVPWWAFYQQIILGQPFGNRPAPDFVIWIILLLFGIGLPALILSLRIDTEVRPDELYLRFFPFRTRHIEYASIKSCAARTYRPILEYGGWGIKWGFKAGWSYTLSGTRGVQLEFIDGKRLLIGSLRADELAAAINAAREGGPQARRAFV